MYVIYEDYTGLGYSAVPEQEFSRYEAMAEAIVRKYTFNRITDENITETNKRGVCEAMEAYYIDDNPQLLNDKKLLTSFSNEGYSEVYAQAKSITAIKTIEEKVSWAINTFFTQEQLYRGVSNVRL